MEIFKDIIGYEGIYQISNLGNVKSLQRISKNGLNSERIIKSKILKNHISKTGYYIIDLKNNNNRKTFKVHRLIAIHFIDNIYNKGFINHINGIKTDNRIENLEWVTCKENNNHAIILGLKNDSGINNSKSKLNIEDVKYIRSSNLKLKQLANIFNMNESTISKIRLYKTYKNELSN